MPVKRLRELLDEHRVKWVSIGHSPAFTAQEIAALTHIKGRELAKTVVVKLDGEMAMAVVPASFQVDLDLLREASDATRVEIADESELEGRFPQCELGAMPPFGNLYGMDVFAAKELADDEEIAFNAGSHVELVKLPWADYASLVKPRVVDLCAKPVMA